MLIQIYIDKIKKISRGFSLIELIVAIAIFSILASGVVYVFVNSYKNFFGVGDKQVVVQFAQEGMEAVRSIRDNSWQSIVNAADGSDRGLVKNNGLWEFSGTENTLNGLTRVVVVSDVLRNSSGSIVAIDGVDDPDTKRVTVTVSATGISDYVLTTYFTNWSAKMWEQTDWSGTTANEFWASMITASSSYSNISTSTVGQVSLSAVGGSTMSWSAWSDMLPDASVRNQPWEDFYQFALGPDGKSLYVVGTTNFDLVKYDISRAQSGIIKSEWKIEMPWHMRTMAVHPSSNYVYVASSTPSAVGDTVCVANVSTLSVNTASDCYDLTYRGASWYIMSMIVNADGDRLYVFDSYGYGYVFAVSGGGATLSLLNAGQVVASVASANSSINQVYLDESGVDPYIYLVTDDNSAEFRKMGIYEGSGWFSSTSTDAFLDSTSAHDFNDIEYLETVAGKKRFIFGTENSSKELIIYEDQGTSLTEIGSYNLATSQANAEITSDGENMAFIHYYSPGGVYAVNISNRASPTDGGMSNTTFNRRSSWITYDQMLYSTTSHGFFVSDHQVTGDRVNLHFIGRSFTRATGATYDYKRAITLGLGSTVSSGPHTNFPVVISETQADLKTVANGGKVQNVNGYDIIFTSDANGSTVLDHEIETYNPSTGELVAWVKVPSLDTNTTIYMFYGNDAIISTQENVKGVWSNGYQLVNHMVDSGIGAVSDSVVGSNNLFKYGVSAPAQSSGKVGRGQYFDGTMDQLTLENTVDKEQGYNDFTVEFWMKRSSSAVPYSYWSPVFFGSGDVNQDGWMFRQQSTNKKLQFRAGDGTTNLASLYTNNVIADDVWTHVALTADRDVGFQYYINNTADNSCTIAGACTVNSSAMYIGETYTVGVGRDWSTTSLFFTGEVDELRISTGTPRTAGWLTTGYNNVTATSTFYSIASETAAAYYNSPGSIVSSIIDLGSSDKTIDSLNIFQNVPSGCNLNIALEGANNSAFSGYTSANFADSSAPHFTSSTPVTLNNLRYLRYRLTLTACNSNSQTPTLYSLRLNYR